jgi:hypothetical protein
MSKKVIFERFVLDLDENYSNNNGNADYQRIKAAIIRNLNDALVDRNITRNQFGDLIWRAYLTIWGKDVNLVDIQDRPHYNENNYNAGPGEKGGLKIHDPITPTEKKNETNFL